MPPYLQLLVPKEVHLSVGHDYFVMSVPVLIQETNLLQCAIPSLESLADTFSFGEEEEGIGTKRRRK